MELLQDIEDHSRQFPMLSRPTESGADVEDAQAANDTGVDSGSEDEEAEERAAGSTAAEHSALPDMSILDKVRQRLYGDDDPGVTTGTFSFGESLLAKTPAVEETPKIHRLPQLGVEDADFEEVAASSVTQKVFHDNADTQVIQDKTDIPGMYSGVEDVQSDRVETQPLSEEARTLRIKELVERKRQQRLEQEKEILADITHTTLTDEEEDMNAEYNDTVVSSKQVAGVSRKELEEAEMFLNIQKRDVVLQPDFQSKKIFTRAKLLSDFDHDDEEDGIEENSKIASGEHSPLGLDTRRASPVTSPVPVDSKSRATLHSDSEDEIDILDLINTDPKKQEQHIKEKSSDPITSYAHSLKAKTINKDPGSETNKGNMISLESESDGDDNDNAMINEMGSTSFKRASDINIPKLSKEEILTIKQRYSRRRLQEESKIVAKLPGSVRNLMFKTIASKETKGLLLELKKANMAQLRDRKVSDPNHEIIEDLEKDEEIMGTLLEREFERARNIRRKEKMREKAAMALLGSKNNKTGSDKNDTGDEDDEEEVPDSDVNSEVNSDVDSDVDSAFDSDHASEFSGEVMSEDENDKEDEEEIATTKHNSKRKRKQIISFDDSDDEIQKDATKELTGSEPPYSKTIREVVKEQGYSRTDDSYMFGSDPVEHRDSMEYDEFVTTINTQTVKDIFGDGASLSQAYKQSLASNHENIGSHDFPKSQKLTSVSVEGSQELFQNLPSRNELVPSETANSQDKSSNVNVNLSIPSFQSLTDISSQKHNYLETQQITQPDTQPDIIPTQVDNSNEKGSLSQKNDDEHGESDDEDMDITPINVKNAQKSIAKNRLLGDSEEDDDNDTETVKERIKQYEEKIRRKELRMRKRRKELERKGVKNMVEGEAEESEDEWKGLGGVDDDLSDEQANSDDEKMIDNNFNLDLNDEAVRKKFMEQYQIKDQKDLEKLLDDIKNHRLSKRAAGNGFDIELSDEEDELLVRYRNQKLKEQRERLLANKKLQELSKDEKSKAFFDSIQDVAPVISIDDDNSGISDQETNSDIKNRNPFLESTQRDVTETAHTEEHTHDKNDLDEIENEEPIKKTIKVEQSFIQKQLSYLNKDADSDYSNIQKLSNLQHGVTTSDEEVDDLFALKTKSMNNLSLRRSRTFDSSSNTVNSKKRSIEVDTDSDDEFLPSLKKPSIISSFKSMNDENARKSTDSFSGVTVNKQYKVAVASKASITYMSGHKKQVKSLKERQIERDLSRSSEIAKNLSNSTGFDP